MYCPECGHDAADAKYCPECGTDLTAVKNAGRGRTAKAAAPAPARQQRPRTARRAAERRGEPATSGGSRSLLRIWLGFAALAVVVVVVIVAVGSGGGGPTGGAATPAAVPITADTSGSYTALVARANGLYDQGSAAFDNNDNAGGTEAFTAAAKVYGAAWKKQPGDPNVGTDYSVALFYSGQTGKAIKQIDAVLEKSPDFQTAHLNRGIFLKTAASDAKDSGDAAKSADLLSQAKVAFQQAVDIDPATDSGKRAAEQLTSL